MNAVRLNASVGAYRWRFPLWLNCLAALLAFSVLPSRSVHAAAAAPECVAFRWESERLGFNDPKDQRRIRQIESHHFDADTEALNRGKTSTTAGVDIDFLVRYSPNHHRGLVALVRLSLKEKKLQPSGVKIPVECYLLRALEFKPYDAEVQKIYATYLARLGRNAEALSWFEQAEKLLPEDPVIAYNVGLILTENRDFERARMYAKKAYAGGISLPGLREKLARQGQWQ